VVVTVHSGVWHPEDKAESLYRYLPAPLPAGAGALTVQLEYDRDAGVLDLGCFDPVGEFRGWSGGARDRYTITGSWATPGYLPGPLPEGDWQVALALHRVPPDGLPYRLTVTTTPGPEPAPEAPAPWPERPPRPDLPAPDGYRWLAADLHAHTVHSDGTLTVPSLARLAVAQGLDVLAVTDHNTVSHHPHLAAEPGLLLLPGQEVTTDRGHANAFGDIGWIDFRTPAATWLSTVEERGGLLSVNHPLAADCAWLHPLPGPTHLAEIWHSGWWDRTWTAPLAWLQAFDPATVPVGGSDFHDPGSGFPPGTPTTWILCPVARPAEATAGLVLDGLRSGRVAVSASPAGPLLLPLGGEYAVHGGDGAFLVDLAGRRRLVRGERAILPAGDGPHWLADHRGQVLALAAASGADGC
jgi:hypothetical protein